ncbi:hypothetical protein K466DRAFT_240473 [Polyporus arcularius HHB13444]|uniref:Uncharacterized protein n=1 Tax=Polyporus arcularius HHB13444 TaxID=1314778 RepID=A0A5C3PDK5_9APHY|nr:hypothetical protein K466DRAFT_240473 [Polyporus arcularius HHB13444]
MCHGVLREQMRSAPVVTERGIETGCSSANPPCLAQIVLMQLSELSGEKPGDMCDPDKDGGGAEVGHSRGARRGNFCSSYSVPRISLGSRTSFSPSPARSGSAQRFLSWPPLQLYDFFLLLHSTSDVQHSLRTAWSSPRRHRPPPLGPPA